MPVYLAGIGSTDPGKYAAWITIVLLSFLGLLFTRQHMADLLMKIYRYFIQNNALGL